MLHKLIPHVYIVVLLVAVSHSGHHDSPVRGIVICYTKSFHLLSLLFLFVAASHSGHQDSLVSGIMICYTKSVGTPHGERVVCPPVERGRASAEETHPSLFGLWPCGCLHSPPTHLPPALHFVGLTCCPILPTVP
jgi:hypothetical protein